MYNILYLGAGYLVLESGIDRGEGYLVVYVNDSYKTYEPHERGKV